MQPSQQFPVGPATGGYPTPPGARPGQEGIRGPAEIMLQVGRDGPTGIPAEAGRYQLYASLACPWSQRALIVRRLLGLDRVIGLTLADPVPSEHGWRFGELAGGRGPRAGGGFFFQPFPPPHPCAPR